jgi:hypothetical protein
MNNNYFLRCLYIFHLYSFLTLTKIILYLYTLFSKFLNKIESLYIVQNLDIIKKKEYKEHGYYVWTNYCYPGHQFMYFVGVRILCHIYYNTTNPSSPPYLSERELQQHQHYKDDIRRRDV